MKKQRFNRINNKRNTSLYNGFFIKLTSTIAHTRLYIQSDRLAACRYPGHVFLGMMTSRNEISRKRKDETATTKNKLQTDQYLFFSPIFSFFSPKFSQLLVSNEHRYRLFQNLLTDIFSDILTKYFGLSGEVTDTSLVYFSCNINQ